SDLISETLTGSDSIDLLNRRVRAAYTLAPGQSKVLALSSCTDEERHAHQSFWRGVWSRDIAVTNRGGIDTFMNRWSTGAARRCVTPKPNGSRCKNHTRDPSRL